jgi:hypothetical protein
MLSIMPMSRRLLWLCTVVIGAFYLLIATEKPVAVLYDAAADEAMFFDLAGSIVSGHWLGPYNVGTFAKGTGYPLFIAANYLTGMPIGLGQSVVFFAAVIYFSFVYARTRGDLAAFLVCVVSLLTVPVMYTVDMQRLLRDFFYTAITLAYFAALFDLLLDKNFMPWRKAVLAGTLAGVFWLTREEGIWIVPASLLIVACAIVRTRPFRAQVFKPAVALASAMAAVAVVGLINLQHYGRYVLNEVKDSDFQAALASLQRAAYPDQQPYVPVPKAARLRIYQYSPSFAKLKSFLDPDNAQSPWNFGCASGYPVPCDEIAGGWFVWAIRDAAGRIGAHSDPTTAAHFYRQLSNEVEDACSTGKLTCGPWLPPLIPYLDRAEIFALPGTMMLALKTIGMRTPMSFVPYPSSITRGGNFLLNLLNMPPPGRIWTIRTDVYIAWSWMLTYLQRYVGWFMLAGFILFACSTITAVRRREFPFGLLMAGTLWLAVLSRAALLSVIQVTSFYAVQDNYAAPAIVLAVAASVLSFFEAWNLRPWRKVLALELRECEYQSAAEHQRKAAR